MGEDAHIYFRMLLEREPYWFRIVRSILGLRRTYGDEIINACLKRAFYYNVLDVTTIKNILEKKLYMVATEPKLPRVGGTDSILNRELTYYTA
jgi:hypothetical protein